MTDRDLDLLIREQPLRSAVAALTGYCNAICDSGDLSMGVAKTLRELSETAWEAARDSKVPA